MKPAPFAYSAPTQLTEALALLREHEDARPIAGGQSLVPMLALRLARPALLVDLNRIESLSGISRIGNVIRVGAMTRQADALRSRELAAHAPLVVEALRHVGHPPTRARGTIGGSLAHADPAAELPAVMVALDAAMVVRSIEGERRIRAADFFLGAFETELQPGEILVAVELPSSPGGAGFVELSLRHGEFAIVSAAACLELSEAGSCTSAALVLGGVADRPLRCTAAEAALLNHLVDRAALTRALAALPLADITMHSAVTPLTYRRRVAPVLARRALEAALAGARAERR